MLVLRPWLLSSRPTKLKEIGNLCGTSLSATISLSPLSTEISSQSRSFLMSRQREQFEPRGLEESLIHPPPFSRGIFLIFGSFLGLAVASAYATNAPMLVERAAQYQLIISSLAVPFFASVDKTFCSNASSFSNRFWPMIGVYGMYGAQGLATTLVCTHLSLAGPGRWQSWAILGLWGLHATCLWPLRNTLPLWLIVWRGIAAIGIFLSACAMHRRMWVIENKEQITLRGYKR